MCSYKKSPNGVAVKMREVRLIGNSVQDKGGRGPIGLT